MPSAFQSSPSWHHFVGGLGPLFPEDLLIEMVHIGSNCAIFSPHGPTARYSLLAYGWRQGWDNYCDIFYHRILYYPSQSLSPSQPWIPHQRAGWCSLANDARKEEELFDACTSLLGCRPWMQNLSDWVVEQGRLPQSRSTDAEERKHAKRWQNAQRYLQTGCLDVLSRNFVWPILWFSFT